MPSRSQGSFLPLIRGICRQSLIELTFDRRDGLEVRRGDAAEFRAHFRVLFRQVELL